MHELSKSVDNRISIGLLCLKVSLLIIITVHFILPGSIPYIAVLGYLLHAAGLTLLKDVSKRFRLATLFSCINLLLSIVVYILIFKLNNPDSVEPSMLVIDAIASLVIMAIDIVIIFITCLGFKDKGIELESAELCNEASETMKMVFGFLVIVLAYNIQWVFTINSGVLRRFIWLLIIIISVYIYMDILSLLRTAKRIFVKYNKRIITSK